MKKIAFALGLLSVLAIPAKAEPYFIQLTTSTSYAVVNSTSSSRLLSNPVKFYSLQVRGSTGTVTSWDVRLEVSIDGVNFSQVIGHNTDDGNGTIKTSTIAPSGFPATYMRIRTNAISLATVKTLIINALGTQ